MDDDYVFELWQDDLMVAKVSSADIDAAEREIRHYAKIYGQDGICLIRGGNTKSRDYLRVTNSFSPVRY